MEKCEGYKAPIEVDVTKIEYSKISYSDYTFCRENLPICPKNDATCAAE